MMGAKERWEGERGDKLATEEGRLLE